MECFAQGKKVWNNLHSSWVLLVYLSWKIILWLLNQLFDAYHLIFMGYGISTLLWSRTLECSVEVICDWSSTKCYFNEFLFLRVITHDEIEWIYGCERSECHGLPVFLLGLPQRGGCWKQSKWAWNMMHSMSLFEVNLDWLHLLQQWGCLKGYGLGPTVSCEKWAKYTKYDVWCQCGNLLDVTSYE